ncbi:MAG: DUF4838 domain-containing protein [Ferruginibacter sp.]
MRIKTYTVLNGLVSLLYIAMSITLVFVFHACSGGKNEGGLIIGEKGNMDVIVIPGNANEVIKFAATELQTYLKKMTGRELQIKESQGIKDNERVIRLIIEDNNSIKWDGFNIEISKAGIRISAKEGRALVYAVYSLLEQAGCSFFYPGEQEEIVPHRRSIEFPRYKHLYNPILEHRGLALYGLQASSVELGRKVISWMAKNKMNFILVSENRPSDSDGPANGAIWKEVNNELLPELQKRGFIIEMSEHCAPVFFPTTLFKDHPDWFALNQGVRKLGKPPYSGQMCYSNKDAVEFYATAIANYAAKHPEFHIIGTWPLDGGEYCECNNCKAPETVFRAAMRVAEKVYAVRPDMIVEHLAYKPQTWVPPIMEKIPHNMSVLWCPDLGNMEGLLTEWVKKSDQAGGLYQFEYYMGDNYRTCTNVVLRPGYSAKIPVHAKALGFRGVISLFLPIQNWWRSSFNNWFFARACWDSALDVNAGIRDHCKNYYGSHANEVENVFNLILNDMQPEPYIRPIESGNARSGKIKSSAEIILKSIGGIISNTKEPEIITRLQRLKTYVEFSLLHAEAFTSLKKVDFERLINYSNEHADQEMVLMYPGYIRWRNEEYFTR